jgi:hypothetical protein
VLITGAQTCIGRREAWPVCLICQSLELTARDRSGSKLARKLGDAVSHKNLNPTNPDRPKRVAIVISNPSLSTTTGWPVGFWWAELTHPYFHFTEAETAQLIIETLGR